MTINNKRILTKRQKIWLEIFMGLGVATFIIGLFIDPTRTWSNILLSGYFITGIGFCGIMMVAIHYVSNSGWDVVLRRVPEAMFSVLPIGFIFMILLYFGMHDIYEWSHKDVVATDPILKGKSVWLNPIGFMIRMVTYFVFWIWVGRKIISKSQAIKPNNSSPTGLSAFWLYIGGILFIFSSFDWIMSLEPHWFSTIFGLYNFSGMFTSGLAFMMIALIFFRRAGILKDIVKIDHLYELSRYLFGFVTFWVYIWFSQHMLIWYANIPEETVYYIKRHVGVFGSLTVVNILFNWFIPFSILLFRKTKRNEKSLLIAASLVLVGRWVDLYMMIFPPNFKSPVFGIQEIAIFIGTFSLLILVFVKTFQQNDPVPENDPFLNESLHLHT